MMLIGWQTWLVARTWFWCQRDFAASDSLSRASTIDPKPPIVSLPLIRKRCLTISLALRELCVSKISHNLDDARTIL